MRISDWISDVCASDLKKSNNAQESIPMASSPTLTADGEALSPWWVRSVFIVMFVGFAALIGITGLAYHNAPPIPAQVVDDTGQVLFTGEHISNGQEVLDRKSTRLNSSH